MRSYIWVLALAAITLLCHETLCLAADRSEKPGIGMTNGAFYQIFHDDYFNNLVSIPTEILLASDSDRGCCVLKTSQAKCVYTNRAYCTHKAKQAGISFEFHMGTDCKSVPVCK